MIVLIVGSTGAGKTTYAQRLAKELRGVAYSIDDWMRSLYWQDMPSNPDMEWFRTNFEWYMARIERCENVILKDAIDRARLNQNSVLDLGFTTASHRKKFIEIFSENGIATETHFLNLNAEARWKRVEERNANKGETFVMHVDRQMFEYIESIFEPPQESEGATIRLVKDGQHSQKINLNFKRMTETDFQRWLTRCKINYATDKARANLLSHEEATKLADNDFTRFLPDGLNTKDTLLFTLTNHENENVGYLWLGLQKSEPRPKAFVFDIFIEEKYRGGGYGRSAMLLAEEEAKKMGLSEIELHVFGFNNRAINLYKSLGYEVLDLVMSKKLK